jgi:EAL domain-containing protein (putative c-di-GMP-specific phosphodiesterase class I)
VRALFAFAILFEFASEAAESNTTMDAIWFLVGQTVGNESARYVPIHSTPFRVGRQSGLGFTLSNPTVSSVHAEVIQVGQVLALRDLDSTNGTYVNGQRVTDQVTLDDGDLIQFADVAFRLRCQTAAVQSGTIQTNGYDRALALVQFDNLMQERSVVPHFQPIVNIDDQTPIGYEVLVRSRIVGLETPAAMFTAAAQLNLEVELSRMIRWEAMQACEEFPESTKIFLNTHPSELGSPELFDSLAALRKFVPKRQLVLEIHESAVTDPEMMSELGAALRDLDIGLAYDDFGAGQARLVELIDVRPDYLKFDMSLVQKIDEKSDERRQMLATLVRMTRELGVAPLAEGVESEGEHLVCQQMGFEFSQGFFYGKPAPADLWMSSLSNASSVSAQSLLVN